MTNANDPQEDKKSLLKSIKSFDFSKAQVRVFFAKVHGSGDKVKAQVIAVSSAPGLDAAVVRSIKAKVDSSNNIEDYDFNTANPDDSLFLADSQESNWNDLSDRIAENKLKDATNAAELKNANLVIFELLVNGQDALFGVKKLDEKLTPKRLEYKQFIFSQGKLDVVPDGARVLNMSLGVHFFVWQGRVFITNVKKFEEIMNIREGMARKRDSLIEKLSASPYFKGAEELKDAIGNNLHRLRRASKAHDADHVAKSEFVEELINLCAKYPHWSIEVEDGRIVITKDNVDDVLSLLSDQRAETLINKVIIDAVVSKPVPKAP